MDDATRLLLAARDGDETALAGWIRRTQPEVWRLCARLVDPEAADDVTQEVYLRACRALGNFRGDASSRTWLLTIARRTCADVIRRRTRRRRLDLRLRAEPQDHAPDLTPGVDAEGLLAALDPDQREAFVLTQTLGLSYAEAAEVAEVPVGTIRSRVSRARAALLEALSAVDGRDAASTG